MATRTITLTVSSFSEGFGWNVSFTVDDATPIRNINNFAINCNTNNYGNFSVPFTGSVNQVVNGYSSHYSGLTPPFGGTPNIPATSSDDSYVTWRSNLRNGQFPTLGKSLDIWSDTFYNDIMYSSFTWSQMSPTYTLNPRKWSTVYDYSSSTAFVWSKGGILTIS